MQYIPNVFYKVKIIKSSNFKTHFTWSVNVLLAGHFYVKPLRTEKFWDALYYILVRTWTTPKGKRNFYKWFNAGSNINKNLYD
jgi:hypothetical protein